MISSRFVCTAVLCLVTTGLYAQGQGAGNPSPPLPMQQQSNNHDASLGVTRHTRETDARRSDTRKKDDWNPNLGWDATVGRKASKKVWSISEARENLAKEWQRLGIPAEQATVIAAAYDARPARHHSLHGESKQEIAAKLQGALKSKDYRLANQLLIDYQHDNLQYGADQ